MKKWYWVLVVVMVFTMVFAGWVSAADPEPTEEPKAPEDIVIGVSLDRLYLGRQAEMKGVRDAAKEMGVTLLEAVADNDPQLQNSQIESFIAQGVDVVMIVAVDMEAIKTGIRACEEAGIPFEPELVVESKAGLAGGYESMRKLLALARPPTAVFTHNDVLAVGAMRAIADADLRVPEDISVVGYDDTASSSYLNPTLTTVKFPVAEMGRQAGQIILQLAQEEASVPTQTLLLPVELMIRASTAPPASRWA